jgi:formylglycine-generating enzyme required for sulfatase activity/predicted DNA-binding WGR domain protein
MRRIELSDSTSNKFWEVDVNGKTLNVTFGKIGTKGQSKPKDFATPEKAKAEMEKLIKEKTGKGYVEVGGKAVKAIKYAAKPAVGKKTSAGSVGKGLSKAGKLAKTKKVLLMFAGGHWELARGILEVAQDEHWLFEELLKGCEIEDGKPKPSTLIKKAFSRGESAKAELVMLEVLLHLPKELEELQKLRDELGLKLIANMLSNYWKEVVKDKFEGVMYGYPEFFDEQWYQEREAEIVRVEKESEARGKALNKQWRVEEDLGQGVKLEMVLISAGKFKMGSPESEKNRSDDEIKHEVIITKSYYLGKYEVTQEQWESVMGDNPSFTKDANLPVTDVSWNDCQEFIRKLNEKTKGKYRLPSEAEWEYACRAGTSTAYSFGDECTHKDANCVDSNIGKPVAVGSYKPNAFGLYDMHGNVCEWCADEYDYYYSYGHYPKGALIDPNGPANGSGSRRVVRSGSFSFHFGNSRSSERSYRYDIPSNIDKSIGFRLARTI